ncbi:B-box zinc finger protein [Terriglobus tenax]|uniref:B-box zinc finger protein n=1 Tax=Terriglobus tenax TaxID=1111115 RepID=UPI0021DF8076|nr:B-box zinc finger protein [Terriglobus tenax]
MMCANHNDREHVAFCQNCGKPLCQECTRTVGTAVFCEPCLAAKISGAVPPPSASTGWQPVSGAAYGTVPPPASGPNPSLAGLLGLIPGVGAMYNGQFAKGIVHLAIFAVLVSLSDHVDGIFGMFVAGWIFYMVFDAYQTAKARRDGTPLPNPFGLNEVGEKFGFGKAWPSNNATGPVDPSAIPVDPVVPPPPPAGWSAPYTPPVNPYAAPPVPPMPSAYDPNWQPAPANRFPAGAVWLIGLGLVFLVGNTGILGGMSMRYLWPFLLIGFGIWIFVRKMTDAGMSLGDDGTPGYRLRVLRALRGSVWIIVAGVLFLLNETHALSWGHSWPIFLIVVGVLAIAERAAYSDAAASQYYAQPTATATGPAAPTSTGVEPADRDGEAR